MENSEQALVTIPLKNCTVLITDRRLVFIKTSGGSAGALIGGVLGGAVGGAIAGAIQKKIDSRKQQTLTIDELLKKDKKNYAIAYDEVDSVTFKTSQWSKIDPVKLTIYSNKGKKEVDTELNHIQGQQVINAFSSISSLNGKIRQQYY